MNISGTLSANNPRDVIGTWQHIPATNTIPGRTGNSGAVVFTGSQQHIVSVGGCQSTDANVSCADGLSYVVNADSHSSIAPARCPAPRNDPTITTNVASGNGFGSQVYQLLGTFNSSIWDDDGGLNKGEVVSIFDNHCPFPRH